MLSVSTNRLTVAVELYSAELITWACFAEANDRGLRTDLERSTFLATALKAIIDSQPQLITKLLEKLETFNSLANKLSHVLLICVCKRSMS